MTSILIRDTQKKQTRRSWPHDDGADTEGCGHEPRMPGAPRSWKRSSPATPPPRLPRTAPPHPVVQPWMWRSRLEDPGTKGWAWPLAMGSPAQGGGSVLDLKLELGRAPRGWPAWAYCPCGPGRVPAVPEPWGPLASCCTIQGPLRAGQRGREGQPHSLEPGPALPVASVSWWEVI